MSPALYKRLQEQLLLHGFTQDQDEDFESPMGTMNLSAALYRNMSAVEFIDSMVTRREKISASYSVVGRESAEASYKDVVAIIDSIKTAVGDI